MIKACKSILYSHYNYLSSYGYYRCAHSIKMKFKIGIFISLVSSLLVIDLLYGVMKPKERANNHLTVMSTTVGFYSLIQSNWTLDNSAVSLPMPAGDLEEEEQATEGMQQAASDSQNKIDRRKQTSNYGYILSSEFSDQVTAGLLNVMSLQCWAATVSHQLRVVEPFLHMGSKLGFAVATPNNDKNENLLAIRDVLNIEEFEKFIREKNYSPLSTWNSFLEDTPRDLILVCSCPFPSRVSCEDQNKTFYQDAMTFAENNDFQVVRYVYLVKYPYIYKATEFRKLVYGQFSPNTSVVLFNFWGGILNAEKVPRYRFGISDMDCSCGKFSQTTISLESSELIHQDAQRYMKKYLHKKYVSVMFRTEYFSMRHSLSKLGSTEQMILFTKCVNSISDLVDKMKKKYGIESVFLAMDCRKQGSLGYKIVTRKSRERAETLSNVSTLLYRKLYGNSSSLEDWDDSFDNISSYKIPGYIAQLQKYLAASGTCLLTAGGGLGSSSFQESAKVIHRQKHNTQCIHVVPDC